LRLFRNCPAGRAPCAGGGHFVTFILLLGGSHFEVFRLVGTDFCLRPTELQMK
jgi:hypothetical protein